MEVLIQELLQHTGSIVGFILVLAFITIVQKIKSDLCGEVLDLVKGGFKNVHKIKIPESISCTSI